MNRKVEAWSVEKLHKKRAEISFPEYQRQPNLWSDEKQSLLIDSMMIDIDIPKLYFNRTNDGSYEVVDGQQRLWAVWNFLDGLYRYRGNGSARYFRELSPSERERIMKYELQVAVLQEAEDEYLRQLFLRLQLGLLLITGEKLNAARGAMKRVVFDKLAKHAFVESLGIPQRRYARETLCAQISINSFSRAKLSSFARTRYEDLQHFFEEYEDPHGKDLDLFKSQSGKILGVLDKLRECFRDKAARLRSRSYILSLYLLAEQLDDTGELSLTEGRKRFTEFALLLWTRLREEIKAGIDRKNKELYTFESLLRGMSH